MTAGDIANCWSLGGHRRCERITLVRYSPPCITARRGGCVLKKMLRSHRTDADGVVFLCVLNRKTTPASRSADASRYFMIARPPLLAVMQGGEYARFQLVHTFLDRTSA